MECRLATAEPKKDDPSCFLKPVPADVLDSAGNKLAGAAQRRTKQGCLHQGSILLPGEIPGNLPEKLTQNIQKCLGTELQISALTPEEEKLAHEMFLSRYATRAWNHSR